MNVNELQAAICRRVAHINCVPPEDVKWMLATRVGPDTVSGAFAMHMPNVGLIVHHLRIEMREAECVLAGKNHPDLDRKLKVQP